MRDTKLTEVQEEALAEVFIHEHLGGWSWYAGSGGGNRTMANLQKRGLVDRVIVERGAYRAFGWVTTPAALTYLSGGKA